VATGHAVKIGAAHCHLPHQGGHGAVDHRPGSDPPAALRTGGAPLLVLGAIVLLDQRLGQGPRQFLALRLHRTGDRLQGRFRLLHLLLHGIQPLLKALVQLLPELCSLLLLSSRTSANAITAAAPIGDSSLCFYAWAGTPGGHRH